MSLQEIFRKLWTFQWDFKGYWEWLSDALIWAGKALLWAYIVYVVVIVLGMMYVSLKSHLERK